LPLGTHYPKVVERVAAIMQSDIFKGHTVKLVVDMSGVGRPVVDMLREASLRPYAITITGGDTATLEKDGARVPKRELVTTLQAMLQQER
jgi:hypothetical protein